MNAEPEKLADTDASHSEPQASDKLKVRRMEFTSLYLDLSPQHVMHAF
jgi:hypothetical protein